VLLAAAMVSLAGAISVPQSIASPDVPLDSWTYPALLRLTALGYVRSDLLGLRPWSRLECARLVEEAGERLSGDDIADREARRTYDALAAEFAPELRRRGGEGNREVVLESVYTRVTNIAGIPLRDGFHFGQTLVNDFGRPYREGANALLGFSARASIGPLAVYARGEYQHAPAAPATSTAVLDATAAADFSPPQSSVPFPAVNRFRWLDSYAALALRSWRISFGKQSLWWGPSVSGPLLLSDNAEPMTMLRLTRTIPPACPGSWAGWERCGRNSLWGDCRVTVGFGRISPSRPGPRPAVRRTFMARSSVSSPPPTWSWGFPAPRCSAVPACRSRRPASGAA